MRAFWPYRLLLQNIFLISAKLNFHRPLVYSTIHCIQYYTPEVLQEWSMVKKLSCVSCGSLKRFLHTFTILPESSSTNEVSLLRGVGRMKCSGIIFEGACLIYAPTFFRKIFCNLRKTSFRREGPNLSTTPLRQWGFRQCLPFSWTILKGKYCKHSIAVVDKFGL